MQVEFLIVGQGVCGTFLSFYLRRQNRSFVVIDKNEKVTPSKMSAGVINPVTGRRLVKVWMADTVIPFAVDAYEDLGTLLGVDGIARKHIIDFFPNVHQRQVFLERIEEGEACLHSYPEQNDFNADFNYELGCGEIRPAYTTHLHSILPAWKKKLEEGNQIISEDFDPAALSMSSGSIRYRNIHAEKIIFCDGTAGITRSFFSGLPFAPNKGEALILEIPGLNRQYIYKKGFLLVPFGDEEQFWLGSNYQWEFADDQPSSEFFEQASKHAKSWIRRKFTIVGHVAAIRPATLERRPFVGMHPVTSNVGILNGMGTKGCSLAPYFASQLVQHLICGEMIDPLADISRFRRILSTR
ncbi:MAG TPA: FAD-dependent oxidoreductase [Chitinophagaceae bacterium]|jgi:glycine/D-amino acid oxidase-like deaminating enzyme